MSHINGCGVALVTPFKKNGDLDEPGLINLCKHLSQGDIDFFVALGTTGEVATLSRNERYRVIELVKTHAGSKRVVVGCGGNNTRLVSETMKELESTFAPDAFLTVSPYYNKPTQEGIIKHYLFLAENTETPIVLYNVPSRTGSNISSDSLKVLRDHPGIISIKESSGDFVQAIRYSSIANEEFSILSGDDYTAFPVIKLGGNGLISVLGNAMPELVKELVDHSLENKDEQALKIQAKILPLLDLCFQDGNPTGVKGLLSIMGICEATTRLPIVSASDSLLSALKKELRDL